MSLFAFPKKFRVLKRKQYLYTQRRGICFRGKHVVFYVSHSHSPDTKLGVTVSKKFGKAVVRNRFKRCVREAFRHARSLLPQCDIVVMPITRKEENPSSVKDVFSDFINSTTKIQELLQKKGNSATVKNSNPGL